MEIDNGTLADRVLELLRDVSGLKESLKNAQTDVDALTRRVNMLEAQKSVAAKPPVDIKIDLNDPYNDRPITRDPKRWQGETFVGKTMSQCSPEYLECMAELCDWKAKKDDESGAVDGKGGPKSKWSRLDAARCRAWIEQIRNAPTKSERAAAEQEDEIPF